ncbi:MAG: prepilin-type N-terminal cleavage/methylation domain-containing protein [Clostridiales bacterium]|nr:prepilin-type N-terminal cleavage/methylation domain-containing protein [Clostridiales bacterium]
MKTIKRCDFNNQVGFTLAEVLIAITLIGLVIVAGFTIYGFGLSYFKLGQDQTKTQQDLRRIAETISKEMRIAEEVEIFDQVPQAENGYTDIYFKDETVYIRRDTNIPLVLSDSESAQVIDGLFSNRENILVDFTLKSSLNKGEYSINSSVRPLNLNGDIMGLPSGKVARFKNPPIVPIIDFALFASGDIVIKPSGTIKGDVVTNANGSNVVKIDYGGKIEGDLALGVGADVETAVQSPKNSNEQHVENVWVQNANRYFPQPVFPDDFPNLEKDPNNPNLQFDNWDQIEAPLTKDDSGRYERITIVSRVQIDVDDEDVIFRTDKLDLSNSGDIVINRQGKGRVYFYVDEEINVRGSSSLNWLTSLDQSLQKHDKLLELDDIQNPGDPSDVIVFYRGNEKMNIEGGTKLNATVIIKNKPVVLAGSGGITGDIVTGTTETIEITGGADAFVRVLYAPNATIKMTGSGLVRGAIIGKSFEMEGGTKIEYNPLAQEALYSLAEIITFR